MSRSGALQDCVKDTRAGEMAEYKKSIWTLETRNKVQLLLLLRMGHIHSDACETGKSKDVIWCVQELTDNYARQLVMVSLANEEQRVIMQFHYHLYIVL